MIINNFKELMTSDETSDLGMALQSCDYRTFGDPKREVKAK